MQFGDFKYNLGKEKNIAPVAIVFDFKVDSMQLYITQDSLGNRLSRAEIEKVVSDNSIDISNDIGFFIKEGHSKKFFVWYFKEDDTYGYEKLSVV